MSRPFALGLTLGCTLLACGEAEPVPELQPELPPGVVQLSPAQVIAAGVVTTKVAEGPIREEISVPGSVQSPDTAHAVVGSIVEGMVVAVRVLPGDVIRRRQPLVEIHSHELAEAQRDLASATAELEFRRSALARSERLLDAGAVALEEVERRRADLSAAEAELRLAQDIVGHLAPSRDGDVQALAPVDGTVFAVHARPGQAVVPGDPLVEVGSTDVLWVTAFVPEHTASTLLVGDTVAMRFDSPPARTTGRLVRAGNYVDPGNRSVEMRFELDSIPRGVRPGSFATVVVSGSSSLMGVELTDEAVVRIDDGDAVFHVVGQGLYQAVPVSVVSFGDGTVAVRGVPDGSEVVVAGAYFLKAAHDAGSYGEEGP